MKQKKPSDVFNASCFAGRVYGVTGAAHGIGEATVDVLLEKGARVVVIDCDAKHTARVREKWRVYGDAVMLKVGDVGEDKGLKGAVAAAGRRWGRIDGWVSNATVNPSGNLEEQTSQEFERGWRVNTWAAWRASQLVLPMMRRQGGGAIVNLGSMLAHKTYPFHASYASAKAGLEGLTRALAVELAPDRVRVNTVVPGMINVHTDGPFTGTKPGAGAEKARTAPGTLEEGAKRMSQLRRGFGERQWHATQPWPLQGMPGDVASVILFLLSDASCFITGTSILVDGGVGAFFPAMITMPVDGVAQEQQEMHAIAEKYPSLRLRNVVRYPRVGGKVAGKK